MRRVQVLLVLAAVAVLASGVSADVIDPQIIIRGGAPSGTIYITNQAAPINLQFTSNLSTVIAQGCTTYTDASMTASGLNEMGCPVVNDTPTALAGLVFHISPAFQLPLTLDCGSFCITPPTFSPDGSTITFLFIPGLVYGTNVGGLHGEDIFITFAGFSQGSGITVTVVPEPGTMLLMLGGLGVLGLRRRKQTT